MTATPPPTPAEAIVPLPQGGLLIRTSEGPVQFGVPPETIKDTMRMPDGVPQTFVVPRKMFYLDRGISTAELEFPLYFNFFVMRRKCRIVCTATQKRRLTAVMRESVLGPPEVDPTLEYLRGRKNFRFPDLAAELDYFRKNPFKGGKRLELADMVSFTTFDAEGDARVGAVRIVQQKQGFRVEDNGVTVAQLPDNMELPPRRSETAERRHPFQAPLFGVTAIGAGHGFLPGSKTSGFIVWINRRGILVDPPVDSTDWLREREINPKLIDTVILTHCHADHDSGTMQKLLEEGRCTLVTTPTIGHSFLRKAAALTGLRESYLASLVDFTPVVIGEAIRILGGEFHFRYGFHSIPTIGFECYYGGKSFIYTSDTFNHPPTINKLHEQGVMSIGRRDELVNFPWHHNLVLHECGIPPIHTPLEYLISLPPEEKRNVYVVHTDPAKVPPDSGLRPMGADLAGTAILEVSPQPNSEAIEMLNLFSATDLFRDFPLEKAGEFLMIARRRHFHAGECIIHQGESGDHFYLILSGKASVVSDGNEVRVYGYNDYFGESSLVTELPRTADVYAKTELDVVEMSKDDFLYFIRGTEVGKTLRNLFVNRQLQTWRVLEESKTFCTLSATQKTQLLALLSTNRCAASEYLFKEGEKPGLFHILASGEAVVTTKGQPIARLRRGDFAGKIYAFKKGGRMPFSIQATAETESLTIEVADLMGFLESNPGFYLRLANLDYETFV